MSDEKKEELQEKKPEKKEPKEEKPKEAAAKEASAEKPEPQKAGTEKKAESPESKQEDKKEEVVILEKFYRERHLKNGEVFLKRKTGKPRFRKIVSTNNQAQLYFLDKKNWLQKTALRNPRKIHNLKWHLRNNWQKIDAKEIQTSAK